jgi:hypothetical protein
MISNYKIKGLHSISARDSGAIGTFQGQQGFPRGGKHYGSIKKNQCNKFVYKFPLWEFYLLYLQHGLNIKWREYLQKAL